MQPKTNFSFLRSLNVKAHSRETAVYSEASKSNPQMMLATPMKPIAAKAMKLSEDEKI
jgi:hypothetical protein